MGGWLLAWWLAGAPAWGGSLVVDVLDVGQGDAILVRTEAKAVLIDAALKKADVVGQLRRLGVDHLDLVVTTHPHADHMGGMSDVLAAFPPKLYLDNGLPHTTETYTELMKLVEDRNVPYQTALTGNALRLGTEATIEVLFPGDRALRNTRSDLNSNSVVLLLDHGDVEFLFTGDAEEPTEQALVALGLPDVDVLKVAHHGSEHSSTDPFLRAVKPEIALISCGVDNRYGHPTVEAIDRLKRVGATVYRTDRSGQLRLISDGHTVEVLEGSLTEFAGMRLPWQPVPSPVQGSR